MGSRYSIIVADGQRSADALLAAVGAASWAQRDEIDPPLPEGKVERTEAAWLPHHGWGILVLGYRVGNTSDGSAAAAAGILNSNTLRYLLRDDTTGEMRMEAFESGELIRRYVQVDGAPLEPDLVGPLPARDRYGQIDNTALVGSLLPAHMTLSDLDRMKFLGLVLDWPSTPEKKRRWWQWGPNAS